MADTAIAVTDLSGSEGTLVSLAGTSVSSGNTAVIACSGSTRDLVIIIRGDGTHTATVGIEAGDEPPSELAGLGAVTALSVSATGTYTLPVLSGQFVMSDHGDIELPITGTGPVFVAAVRQSRAQ